MTDRPHLAIHCLYLRRALDARDFQLIESEESST